MTKALLVTNIFPPQIGGPATFIDRLGHSMAARNHDVTVVCSSQSTRDPGDAKRPFAVRRVSLASRERYEVLVRARLFMEMARHRCVFVNGLERYVEEVNRVLRRRYILKIVGDTVWETARNRGVTNLSIDDFQRNTVAQAQLSPEIQQRNRWVLAAQHIVVPSEYLRGLVQGWGVPPAKITVIRNGTTIPEAGLVATARTSRRLRVIYVGRLTNWKGIETLLLAARDVSSIEVEILGDGPEWPHLTELSAQLGLADRVTFRGRVAPDGVRMAMARADVLVLTSLYEGLSHTVLEAFAAGVPCIVSNCGGNEEVVIHAENGLVVPPQNVERLAEALRRLSADEHLRIDLATRALDTARTFDLAETVRQTEHLIAQGSHA
jgi:glycosyltransferase involved in cell wall biosynthesis